MDTPVVAAIVTAAVLLLVLPSLRMVQQYQRGIVFRERAGGAARRRDGVGARVLAERCGASFERG